MVDQFQATSVPYTADVLKAHDIQDVGRQELVWAREFGTNVTTDVGDLVSTPGGEPDIPMTVDARYGMLVANSLQAADPFFPPRGSTFLLPDWTQGPPSPILGEDIVVSVLFAHTLYLQQPISETQEDRVSLLVGPETFVGDNDTDAFQAFSIKPDRPDPSRPSQDNWASGGVAAAPDAQTEMGPFGANIYWRLIMATDGVKGTDFFSALSRDGLTWNPIELGSSLPDVIRRVGLGVSGFCLGALDWARLYSYVIDDCPASGFAIPLPPVTGGRLYDK